MNDLLLLGVLGAAAHYLLYRALITRWLWSRYPARLDAFLSCSACTGFWIGAGVGLYWRYRGISSLGLQADDPALILASALACLAVAPIVAWLQIAALERLGGGVGGEEAAE